MIESINNLKGFGIFNNYQKDPDLKDLNKYNLVYGWNGSGKSTLSKIFECISKKKIIDDFPGADFEINTSKGKITSKNLTSSELDICVFNSNFVRENINWDSIVKSILLISQEKIADKQLLKEKLAQHKIESTKLTNSIEKKTKIEEDKSKTLSLIAKNIKQRFEILDSSDSYYVSYNRTKVQTRLNILDTQVKEKKLLLPKEILEDTKRSASPKFKNTINHTFNMLNAEMYEEAAKRLNNLLAQTAASKTIDLLKENPPIQSWIETGLELHKDHNNCLFCEADLKAERLEALNEHFSQAFRELKERLERAKSWLSSQETPAQPNLTEADFYDEFYKTIPTALDEMLQAKLSIDSSIESWKLALQKKIENPFEAEAVIQEIPADTIKNYNVNCAHINSKIDAHNIKSNNFKDQVDRAKKKLEDHFLTEEYNDSDYEKLSTTLKELEPNITTQTELTKSLTSEIATLEASLSDEAIGAGKFNSLLHKFLGRNHIELKFDETQKGYRIVRQPESKAAKNLSEGEKNAIGLIYFLTKLDENDRDLEDCIIVMDDPVSSFDSNNLFNTHSFLRNHCQSAKQLIILTHNFSYFKLTRDWLTNKNKKRDTNGNPVIKSHFYNIETTTTTPRSSLIKNAPASLLEHNSEYHYTFKMLQQFIEKQELNIEESFAVANIARKLLEAFLTFKHPDARGDFNGLMTKAIKDESLRERIYRFINKYSHNQIIEFDSIGADNVLHETQYIVRDIFQEIERLDKTHYDGMISSSKD